MASSPTTTGLILSFIQPTSSSSSPDSKDNTEFLLLPQLFTSHILGTTRSTLYKAANASYPKQHLLVSVMDDVAHVNVEQVAKFWAGERVVQEEADVRGFSEVQVYEKERGKQEGRDNPAHTLLVALMQPAPDGAADLDAWYHDEHNEQMSRESGWLRTCRYSLIAEKGGDEKEKELSFLAVHEFDESNELGDTVKALEPVSEWTKKVMSTAVGIDAAIYRKI
ncbi:hypothetical protein COCSADRAFT_40566 [Bipolaris sorokiniana ND90Pr]|uniref:EthD domain-containing protein n=1 Tax=Cochliobolus sativus (strain ND90Pr / ATCC 201652) TaxID=665912 RepID=M2RYN1_COCSN|nr:uncharacterized protein COCSADRAFT_40566 [Bipolaris sorokiniana ND90Pr]EMD60133.1 hypothetical protein COCSADRAFT_40566 [Bipolaris sorokiniana ND90Pr]